MILPLVSSEASSGPVTVSTIGAAVFSALPCLPLAAAINSAKFSFPADHCVPVLLAKAGGRVTAGFTAAGRALSSWGEVNMDEIGSGNGVHT